MYRFFIVAFCLLIASCGNGARNDKLSSNPVANQPGGVKSIDNQVTIVKKTFDSIEWKNASLLGRNQYVESLLTSNILMGKNIDFVHDLLGNNDGEFKEDNSIFYKFETGVKMDDGSPVVMSLYIQFDKSNIVNSVIISD